MKEKHIITMFTSGFLAKVRQKALRRGVLYTALDRVERGILYLTSRVVDVVRSVRLGRELVKILAKLKEALKSRFVRHMESYGFEAARKIAEQAAALGYEEARGWARDPGFIKYLTLIDINRPTAWGIH